MCLGLRETVWRCPLERSVFPPQVSRSLWGLLQLNRGGEMHREDLLSPGTWLQEAQ